MIFRRFVLFFLILTTSAFLAVSAAGQTVAIRAGHLIDPKNGTVAKNQIILVKDKKIVAKGADLAIPKDAEILDLSNAWVMPGIMDAHTHVTWGAPKFSLLGDEYFDKGTGLRALEGLRTAQTLLNAGITTVRDVGNDANYAAVDLRRAIDAGWLVGPTILTAGKIIAPNGGQDPGVPLEMGAFLWRFEYLDADGPDQIRAAIRQNIYYGAALIKLVADSNDYHYSLDEIRTAVDEAHYANRAVAVYIFGGEAADNVIRGGVDSFEHGFYLTDEQLRVMKEKGIFLVGTDFPEAHYVKGELPNAKEEAAKNLDRLRRAYKIGVKMRFGTDVVIDLPNEIDPT